MLAQIGDTIVFESLKYLLILVGLGVAIVYFILARKYKGQVCAPFKMAAAFVGLYWAFYYTQSVVFGGIFSHHQVWVRSPLLITLGVFLAMGILSLRRLEK